MEYAVLANLGVKDFGAGKLAEKTSGSPSWICFEVSQRETPLLEPVEPSD